MPADHARDRAGWRPGLPGAPRRAGALALALAAGFVLAVAVSAAEAWARACWSAAMAPIEAGPEGVTWGLGAETTPGSSSGFPMSAWPVAAGGLFAALWLGGFLASRLTAFAACATALFTAVGHLGDATWVMVLDAYALAFLAGGTLRLAVATLGSYRAVAGSLAATGGALAARFVPVDSVVPLGWIVGLAVLALAGAAKLSSAVLSARPAAATQGLPSGAVRRTRMPPGAAVTSDGDYSCREGLVDSARPAGIRVGGRSGWRWAAATIAGPAAAGGLLHIGSDPSATGVPMSMATALAALVVVAIALQRTGLAVGAVLAAVLLTWSTGERVVPARDERLLVADGPLAVVYRRADQEMQVRHADAMLASAGPDRDEEPLAAALLMAWLAPGDRVRIEQAGAGRVVATLAEHDRVLLDAPPAVLARWALRRRAADDGPVPLPSGHAAEPGWSRVAAARPLELLADGSRQAIVALDLPTGARPIQASRQWHRELRRVVGNGITLLPIPLDRVAPELLSAICAAAAAVHPWNGLYVVGDAAVLVGAAAAPAGPVIATPTSDDARWVFHRAHLGGASEIAEALRATFPRGATAAEVTAAVARTRAAPAATGESLLAFWTRRRAELRRVDRRIVELAADGSPAAARTALALATPFVAYGAPTAALQAATGLLAPEDGGIADPGLAARRAQAIDPTFFEDAAPLFGILPRPRQSCSPLEDLAQVVPSPRLASLCCGDSPQAVALRARFPSCCARALVAQLAQGPASEPVGDALRQLADPFVLGEAARLLAEAGRLVELLDLWRSDLPWVPEMAALLRGSSGQRMAVARALFGHDDVGSLGALAELMLAEEPEVRRVTAAAVRLVAGDEVSFDPEAGRSERLDAAERLRQMHNRRP